MNVVRSVEYHKDRLSSPMHRGAFPLITDSCLARSSLEAQFCSFPGESFPMRRRSQGSRARRAPTVESRWRPLRRTWRRLGRAPLRSALGSSPFWTSCRSRAPGFPSTRRRMPPVARGTAGSRPRARGGGTGTRRAPAWSGKSARARTRSSPRPKSSTNGSRRWRPCTSRFPRASF